MKKEKILIDNVDVSGCVNFRDDVFTDKQLDNVCSIGLWQRHYSNLEPTCVMSCNCKDNHNCYYKQLKRKEEECERLTSKCSQLDQLKEDYTELEKRHNDSFEQFKALKTEYEEYRKTHKYNNAEFEQERNALIQEFKYKNRLKTILTEIKKVAEEKANVNDWLALEILQKISECEVNNG